MSGLFTAFPSLACEAVAVVLMGLHNCAFAQALLSEGLSKCSEIVQQMKMSVPCLRSLPFTVPESAMDFA